MSCQKPTVAAAAAAAAAVAGEEQSDSEASHRKEPPGARHGRRTSIVFQGSLKPQIKLLTYVPDTNAWCFDLKTNISDLPCTVLH